MRQVIFRRKTLFVAIIFLVLMMLTNSSCDWLPSVGGYAYEWIDAPPDAKGSISLSTWNNKPPYGTKPLAGVSIEVQVMPSVIRKSSEPNLIHYSLRPLVQAEYSVTTK